LRGTRALVLGALLAGAAALPATAQAADPPEGAAISPNLEYVTRMPEANGITEGKFDEVRGKDVLVITGRFGFKTYDVSEPAKPKLLDEFIPNDLAAGGYWQNEDMELDTKRKLIIGALDPRHTDSPLGACPAGGSTATRLNTVAFPRGSRVGIWSGMTGPTRRPKGSSWPSLRNPDE